MLARLRPRVTYANVVSTLCLFIVLGGAAIAATSFVQTNGTIRGCVTKKGQLTVLKKGKSTCKKGQTKIAWNQVGRQGLIGPPGPATGPAGGDLTGNYPNPTIKPNAVTGANIDESTLGQVPSAANSAQLGGLPPSAFFPSSNVRAFHSHLDQGSFGTATSDALDFNGITLLVDCQRDDTQPPGSKFQKIAFRFSTGGTNPALTDSFVNNTGSGANDWLVSGTPTEIFNRSVNDPFGAEIGTGTIVYRDVAQAVSIQFRYTVGYSSAGCEASGIAVRAAA
jgi:hypothetical protein